MNKLIWNNIPTLCFLIGLTLIWAKAQGLVARSQFFRGIVFRFLPYFRTSPERLSAFLLGSLYYLTGLLCIVASVVIYKIPVLSLFNFNYQIFSLCLLGIATEISLTSFGTSFYISVFSPPINPGETIQKTPWIAGIRNLPKWMRILSPGLAAFLEELMFRGVVLLVLSKIFSNLFTILVIASGLFLVHQVLQTTDKYQALLIGTSSLIVSVIGVLLVISCGSIIPAMVAHISFLILYL